MRFINSNKKIYKKTIDLLAVVGGNTKPISQRNPTTRSITTTTTIVSSSSSIAQQLQLVSNYNINRRCFSSYEYPNRTEAPVITRSVATQLDKENHQGNNSNVVNPQSSPPTKYLHSLPKKASFAKTTEDPFDDSNSLSWSQRQQILSRQHADIPTVLPPSFAIHPHPPSHIPPNLPRATMTTPETLITRLDNGIRVASQETYGQVTTFGLISNCGSRLETADNTGVNYLMELLAYCGTSSLDSRDFQTTLNQLGGVCFAGSSRDQFVYCMDVLRPNVSQAMKLLKDAVLEPRLTEDAVQEMKRVIEFQWMDIVPELLLGEGLQIAGYGPLSDGMPQQLGKSHFCPLEKLPQLNAQVVQQFRKDNLLNPHNLVIAAAGMQHEDIVNLAQEHFGHLEASSGDSAGQAIVPSTYTGGSHRQILPTQDGFTRVALAFPTGGWHSDDLVPSCVLQTLLGGGSSFSAGGPGKGMYSRLYRQVLNRYYWAESCEAFTSFHNETGLMGISGSTTGQKAGDMTRVIAENILRLAIDEVEDEELDRARNMLKNNVLTQLESRLVLFEDIGRQILTYGKREGTKEMCAKIDNVDKKGLKELARKSVQGKKPTLVTVGDDVSHVPAFEEVERWFASL